MKRYVIKEDEFRRLLNGYFQFLALDNGGVDNWE